MELKLTYGSEVLFTKDVELDAKKKQRLVDRVTPITRTIAEQVAFSQAQQVAFEKTLTKEQLAERARVAALKPEERRAELLAKEKVMLEAQLVKVDSAIAECGKAI